MKRSTWTGSTIVYRYGCPSWAKLDEATEGQFRLAHELGNELVAIHRRQAEAVAAAWATHPEVAAAEQRLQDADAAVSEAVTAGSDERRRGRTKAISPETRKRIAEARAIRREAKAAHREAQNLAYDILKPLFVELQSQERAAIKDTYRIFSQERGLYWATWNTINDSHTRAIQAVRARRKQGRSAELRFRRWTGEGSIAVQVQRGADKPPRTPELLASATSPWRNVLRVPYLDPDEWESMSRAEQRGVGRQEIALRIGAKERAPIMCTVPIVMHRPLPREAEVTAARLVRRRVGGHYRLSVVLTVRIPAPEQQGSGPVVSLSLGWRSLGNGAIRVGVWESKGKPRASVTTGSESGLEEALHPSVTGASGEIVLPASWRAQFDKVAELRSLRDTKLNALRSALVLWLEDHPEITEELELVPHDVARWRSPARFAALAIRWREVPNGTEMRDQLEAWRRQDRHLWEWEANLHDQIVARRREAYRVIAASLADAFGRIVVPDMAISDLAVVPPVDQEDTKQAVLARGQRMMAAPGELRQTLMQAAQRRGVPVEVVAGAGTTTTHASCGTDLTGKVDAAERIALWCPVCEEAFDQDKNSARNLLARAVVQ